MGARCPGLCRRRPGHGGSISGCAPPGTGSRPSTATRAAEEAHGAAPTVYGAYHRRGERIALQYWLFYPFNPYSTDVPPNPRFAQVHEGDWELVTVILDGAGRPVTAGYSRHCSGTKRAWAKVPKRGQRPVVYVALGSHANYFAPGTWAHERGCWPELAISVFQQNGKALRDFAGRGRSGRHPGWRA